MKTTDGQKTEKKEQREFNNHLYAVASDAAAKLLLILEMLDVLITWLPDEEEIPNHTSGHETDINAPLV